MKVKNNFTIEIKNDGGYLRGFALIDGVRQLIDIVPREIESSELFEFLNRHVVPAIVVGKQGRVAFKRGK